MQSVDARRVIGGEPARTRAQREDLDWTRLLNEGFRPKDQRDAVSGKFDPILAEHEAVLEKV